MSSIKYEQEDMIDSIKFHLALSNLSKPHPENKGGSTLKDLVAGYAKFVAEELERYERNGVPEGQLDLILKQGGIAMLSYVVGSARVSRLLKAAKEDE